MQKHRPVMLVIMDGWGWREDPADNAVLQARTPTFDRLWSTRPHAFLHTSGRDVGLPDGQMGNSEVGDLTLAPAGRPIAQNRTRLRMPDPPRQSWRQMCTRRPPTSSGQIETSPSGALS
jgi:2,3-bisphosphoglycerate-independent phosphoglycerate mutase